MRIAERDRVRALRDAREAAARDAKVARHRGKTILPSAEQSRPHSRHHAAHSKTTFFLGDEDLLSLMLLQWACIVLQRHDCLDSFLVYLLGVVLSDRGCAKNVDTCALTP